MDKNKLVIAAELLLEDAEDDDIMLLLLGMHRKRKKVQNIFRNRRNEGCFNMLINKHLIDDEIKFREYFRLTRGQFNEVLTLVSGDLKKHSTKCVARPISPSEKLAIVLRYFILEIMSIETCNSIF